MINISITTKQGQQFSQQIEGDDLSIVRAILSQPQVELTWPDAVCVIAKSEIATILCEKIKQQ